MGSQERAQHNASDSYYQLWRGLDWVVDLLGIVIPTVHWVYIFANHILHRRRYHTATIISSAFEEDIPSQRCAMVLHVWEEHPRTTCYSQTSY